MSHLKSTEKEKLIEALKEFLGAPKETLYDVQSKIPIRNQSMNVDDIPRSPYVSYTRGSEYDDNQRNESSEFTTCCVFDNNTELKECQPSKTADISDLDFLDSEAGKQQIFRDQASREMEFTVQPNCRNFTGCSSWTPCSRKRISRLQLPSDFSNLRQRRCVSISEYIGANSEPIGLFTDDTMEVPFLSLITSTPITKSKSCSTFSFLKEETEVFSDFSKLYLEEKVNLARNEFFYPKPMFTLTPKREQETNVNDFHFYIRNTAYRNLNRLKAEERAKLSNSKRKLFHSFEEKTNETISSDSCFTEMQDKTIRAPNKSSHERIAGLWTVQPQEVILGSSKRSRVLIINNSELSLKFKTKFDVKIVDVSPQFGTVLPMSRLGLRIQLSQSAKKMNENVKHDIKLIIGKTVKVINLQIINEQGRTSRVPKERSFIVF